MMLELLAPHAMCLTPEPILILLLVIFHGGIAVSYFVIPLAMLKYFHVGRPPTLVYLFVAFIMGCGGTHIMQTATMYVGGFDYLLEALICGITFIASAGTAIVLLPEGKRIQAWLRTALKI